MQKENNHNSAKQLSIPKTLREFPSLRELQGWTFHSSKAKSASTFIRSTVNGNTPYATVFNENGITVGASGFLLTLQADPSISIHTQQEDILTQGNLKLKLPPETFKGMRLDHLYLGHSQTIGMWNEKEQKSQSIIATLSGHTKEDKRIYSFSDNKKGPFLYMSEDTIKKVEQFAADPLYCLGIVKEEITPETRIISKPLEL